MRAVLEVAFLRPVVLPAGAMGPRVPSAALSSGRDGSDLPTGAAVSWEKLHEAPDLQPGSIGEKDKSVSIYMHICSSQDERCDMVGGGWGKPPRK